MTAVTEPGIRPATDAAYFADPALSHSGAKLLLESPARFHWQQTHPEPPKRVFDVGHAAHALVLGVGAPIAACPDDLLDAKGGMNNNAARAWSAETRERGETPLTPADYATVHAMADALRRHRLASALLDRPGTPEQAAWRQDDETGIWLRCKADHWPDPGSDTRPILVDYKTTVSAAPARFGKSAADYGYHSQAAWYLDMYVALTGRDDAVYVLIAQEKEPPYLVAVYQPDEDALATGRAENREAIALYADCLAADHWPGYAHDIESLTLPGWYRQRTAATYLGDPAA